MKCPPLRISLVSFFFALVYASIVSFVSVYAEELQLTEVASYFFIVYVIALLISRPFTGKWFDQYGANVIMIPSIISFALGMFLLSQAKVRFYSYCLQPLSVSVGEQFSHRHRRLRSKWLHRKKGCCHCDFLVDDGFRVSGSDLLWLESLEHKLDTAPYIFIVPYLSLQDLSFITSYMEKKVEAFRESANNQEEVRK